MHLYRPWSSSTSCSRCRRRRGHRSQLNHGLCACSAAVLPAALFLSPLLLPLLLSLLLLLATGSLPPISREGLLGADGRSRIFMFAACMYNTMPSCTARRFVGYQGCPGGQCSNTGDTLVGLDADAANTHNPHLHAGRSARPQR